MSDAAEWCGNCGKCRACRYDALQAEANEEVRNPNDAGQLAQLKQRRIELKMELQQVENSIAAAEYERLKAKFKGISR